MLKTHFAIFLLQNPGGLGKMKKILEFLQPWSQKEFILALINKAIHKGEMTQHKCM